MRDTAMHTMGLDETSLGRLTALAEQTTKARAQWGDRSDYVLAPGGSFEDGAPAWQLGGASVVPGNESFYVGARSHSKALKLDGEDTTTSPEICVGLEHPTPVAFRFRAIGGGSWWIDDLYVDPRRRS